MNERIKQLDESLGLSTAITRKLREEAERENLPLPQIIEKHLRKQYRLQDKSQQKEVFLVFKQGNQAKDVMENFLRDIGLTPRELADMSSHASRTTISEFLSAGFERCQAFIVLLTPDDEARPREEWVDGNRTKPYLQPRQNVMVETGMALATRAISTILVNLRPSADYLQGKEFKTSPTDIDGIHYVELGTYKHNKSPNGLPYLIQRLKDAGCAPIKETDRNRLEYFAEEFARAIEGERWTATTQQNLQGLDYRILELSGNAIDSLQFEITSKNKYWRAGIVLGDLIDSNNEPKLLLPNSFLFHVGNNDGIYAVDAYSGNKCRCQRKNAPIMVT